MEGNTYVSEKIAIPQWRYEELLNIETRVDVAVELLSKNEYVRTEDILRVLGTKAAICEADRLRDADKKKQEKYRTTASDAGL